MIELKEKKNCCGCTACMSICPKNAISMVPDEEGFLYPKVDEKKCIKCGLCLKTCPILNVKELGGTPLDGYALRTKDDAELNSSTSGGFFTPLAKYVLEKNGVVFGVGYNKEFEVTHKEATSVDEIIEFRGSKYIQSDLNNSYKKVLEYLKVGREVLFTGTPCQVAGLKSFLKKDYDNLITMDVICHGVPSPLLWKKYIEYQTKKYNSGFKNVYFRNKTYGYHAGSMKIVFQNGKEYYGSGRVDYVLKSFFKEISSRPSCYDCKFKTLHHCSEFTVFDCWHASEVIKDLKDDDKGYTNLLVNNNKAKQIFNKISNKYHFYKVNIGEIVKLDGSMVMKSVNPHKNRDEFYIYLNQYGIENAVNKYIPISQKDRVIEKTKGILYKMGLIKIAKAVKNKRKAKKR